MSRSVVFVPTSSSIKYLAQHEVFDPQNMLLTGNKDRYLKNNSSGTLEWENYNVASGLLKLDNTGKIQSSFLPANVMEYVGTYSVVSNSPALADGTAENAGKMYKLTDGGSRNFGSGSITFTAGDWVICNASGVWEKSDNVSYSTTEADNTFVPFTGSTTNLNLNNKNISNVNTFTATDANITNMKATTTWDVGTYAKCDQYKSNTNNRTMFQYQTGSDDLAMFYKLNLNAGLNIALGNVNITPFSTAGIVHNNSSGLLSSSLIVDGDITNATITDAKLATISTAGKVANSATTATNANTASAIVARDASGNFSAGTITGSLTGASSLNVLKAGDSMTGNLTVGGITLNYSTYGVSSNSIRTDNIMSKDGTQTYFSLDAFGYCTVQNAINFNSKNLTGIKFNGSVSGNGQTISNLGRLDTGSIYSQDGTTKGMDISGAGIFHKIDTFIEQGKFINLGWNDSNRESNAGTIGYNKFTDNALSIVGYSDVNTNTSSRLVRIYDNLRVGSNILLTGSTGALSVSSISGFSMSGTLAMGSNSITGVGDINSCNYVYLNGLCDTSGNRIIENVNSTTFQLDKSLACNSKSLTNAYEITTSYLHSGEIGYASGNNVITLNSSGITMASSRNLNMNSNNITNCNALTTTTFNMPVSGTSREIRYIEGSTTASGTSGTINITLPRFGTDEPRIISWHCQERFYGGGGGVSSQFINAYYNTDPLGACQVTFSGVTSGSTIRAVFACYV